ncbi:MULTISPECIES: C45 family autoproteolytic acyltransferase/hydolase [Rhizobium]|uniref:C45 family autoproteolytic acyltransferase/hydolase n=1 Tax=Rhizobium TaxID=379 RepID=UPI000BBDFE02|nr:MULTISPECIES: C45 family peptidase [Rhizobium]PCK83584.1 peptidase C45 [Rhizobium sophoriradicis]PDS73602.1 peptidase C45 [Rhizobium sp. L43]ULJ82406.1 C45 family peptidase [Rhizobium sp. C104]
MKKNLITCVRAKGNAFEIGCALGKANATSFLEYRLGTEQFRALDARWRGSEYLKNLEAAARAAYPRYVREIEGIAEGAGKDFETIFLLNCQADLQISEAAATQNSVAGMGCTTVLIPAEGNGPAVIAHNEDGEPDYLGANFWIEIEPDDGLAWSSFMTPGMLPGGTFGLNESGLVQTINEITPNDQKPGVPRQVLCRAILDAKSLEDAVGILKRNDRSCGFHHTLGDAKTRKVLSVEAPASGCVAVEVTEPRAHANHLLSGEFSGLKQTIGASSRDRQEAADRMIAEGALAGGAEAVLFDETTPIFKEWKDSRTLATSIFELFPNRIEWRIHAARDERNALSGTMRVV